MLPVVQPDADNFFRARHYRAVFDRVFLKKCFLRRLGLGRRIHERIQARAVFILKQLVNCSRRMHMQNLRRFGHNEYSFFVLHAQAAFCALANVQQREPARHAARLCRARVRLRKCCRRQSARHRQSADRARVPHKIPAVLLHAKVSFNSPIFSTPKRSIGRNYIAIHRCRECEAHERDFRRAGPLLNWSCEGLTVNSV